MKQTPILFSTPMVQAILEGRKTMTRRVINPQPDDITDYGDRIVWNPDVIKCPYGEVGDRIWVRETHKIRFNKTTNKYQAMYKCGPIRNVSPEKISSDTLKKLALIDPNKWRPSIFLFKEFSRILLQIKNIRAERLQDISQDDARAEGIDDFTGHLGISPTYRNYMHHPKKSEAAQRAWEVCADDAIHSFKTLWQSINGKESWDANPWVWVVGF